MGSGFKSRGVHQRNPVFIGHKPEGGVSLCQDFTPGICADCSAGQGCPEAWALHSPAKASTAQAIAVSDDAVPGDRNFQRLSPREVRRFIDDKVGMPRRVQLEQEAAVCQGKWGGQHRGAGFGLDPWQAMGIHGVGEGIEVKVLSPRGVRQRQGLFWCPPADRRLRRRTCLTERGTVHEGARGG
jgi:hypothetical protein